MSKERYGDICRKVEDAFSALIVANARDELVGVPVKTGFTSEDIVLPVVRVIAATATAEILGPMITGNWNVGIQITVATNYADTSRGNKSNMAALLFDMIMDDDLTTRLNNSGVRDVTFFGDPLCPSAGMSDISIERSVDEHTHVEKLTAMVYCAPSRVEE